MRRSRRRRKAGWVSGLLMIVAVCVWGLPALVVLVTLWVMSFLGLHTPSGARRYNMWAVMNGPPVRRRRRS
jgi:hypothetical protein